MRLILRRIIQWAISPTAAEQAAQKAFFARMRERSEAARAVLPELEQKPQPRWEYERVLDRLEANRPAAALSGGACGPDTLPPPESGAASPPPHPQGGPTR